VSGGSAYRRGGRVRESPRPADLQEKKPVSGVPRESTKRDAKPTDIFV